MDAALPLPPLPVAATVKRVDPPLLGFVIGAAIPALVASAAWWLDVPWVAFVAVVGIPIGALFAAVVAPRMVGPDWVGATLLTALAAPLVPGALIALGVLAGSIASAFGSGADAIVGGAYFAVIALAVAELGGAPITLPVAFVVALLVRRAFGMPERKALGHVGALAVVTVVIGLVTIAAASGLLVPYGIGRVDPGY